jgi:hypothetical protein
MSLLDCSATNQEGHWNKLASAMRPLSKSNGPFATRCGEDLSDFDGRPYQGIDLLAGGLPCPPFSVAGKQLGVHDERNLFPAALRRADEIELSARCCNGGANCARTA